MTLLVTRPEPQASAWAQALRQAGVPAQALPLIAITEPPRPEAVAQLWHALADHPTDPAPSAAGVRSPASPSLRALMFVSPAAVEGFFRLRPEGCSWPQGTLATAPGPGTAQVLLRAGAAAGLRASHIVSPSADAEQFDSETLWPLLAPMNWQGTRVAIVSGGDASGAQGRTWLTDRWRDAGAQVESVQAYQRGPGTWTPEQVHLAQNALRDASTTWLLSSSQALDFLLDHHLPQLGSAHWQAAQAAHLRLLCTHPRIAEHAARRGIGHTQRCAPTLDSVVQARRSGH